MKNKMPYICLILGAIAYTFCGYRFNVPITAWIWPFLLLFFMRDTKGKKGILLLLLVLVVGTGIKSLGVLGDIGLLGNLAPALIGILFIIPFTVDKIFYKRLPEPWNTLLFPLAWASLEVIKSYSPFGTVGHIAYSQAGNLPLVQMTSIFGCFGLTFLILWFGTVLMYVFENDFSWQKIKNPVCIYLVVLIACFSFGGIRLLVDPVHEKTAMIACAFGPEVGSFAGEYETLPFEDNLNSLKSSAEKAHAAGADILMWNEDAFCIEDTNMDEMVETAKELAKKNDMWYIFPLEVEDTDDSDGGLSLNISMTINSDGEITETYKKAHLVPFVESGYYVEGDEYAKVHKTPYGNIATVICFDSAFPQFINNICRQGVDTLFVPSWDWYQILSYNTKEVEFRAVENGVNLIRTTYDGLTEAVDAKGRVLVRYDTFSSGFEEIAYAHVPTKGTTTIYSVAGQFINWFYVAALIVLIILGLIGKRKNS